MASRMVHCVKLQKEAPGIDPEDLQGQLALDMVQSVGGTALRQRIYESVSWEAWQLWRERLTMIMNEYRLNMADPQADEVIRQQMEDFFFGEGSAPPSGYVPPRDEA
jgi:Fe-S cluster biosynthesis and repair protein YggX